LAGTASKLFHYGRAPIAKGTGTVQGKVTHWNAAKGYGFIEQDCGGDDLFAVFRHAYRDDLMGVEGLSYGSSHMGFASLPQCHKHG
jgi:hypothetical protein